jgi:hypothetical protein
MILRSILVKEWGHFDWISGSKQGNVVSWCEHGDEHPGSQNAWNVLSSYVISLLGFQKEFCCTESFTHYVTLHTTILFILITLFILKWSMRFQFQTPQLRTRGTEITCSASLRSIYEFWYTDSTEWFFITQRTKFLIFPFANGIRDKIIA